LFGGAILFAQYRAFEALVVSELITECDYAQSGLLSAADEKAYLERLSSRNRLTLIATDGTVLFDSASDVTKMDNHADRPEISDVPQRSC